MKLVIARPSPFARKIRIVLLEKNIDFQELIDAPWKTQTIAAHHNPLGKVPILINNEGEVFYDSRIISEYLDTFKIKPTLIPAHPKPRIKVHQIETLADGICDSIVLITLESCREKGKQSKKWIDRQQLKIERGVAALDDLHEDDHWFVGGNMTIADIAVACMLGYLSFRLPRYSL